MCCENAKNGANEKGKIPAEICNKDVFTFYQLPMGP
jgi:hypothetical protein